MNTAQLSSAQRAFDNRLPLEDAKREYIDDCIAEQSNIDKYPYKYNRGVREALHAYITELYSWQIISDAQHRVMTSGIGDFEDDLRDIANEAMDKADLLIAERRYADRGQ